jgi:hypothetical protein
MLSISNYSDSYAAQSALSQQPKVPKSGSLLRPAADTNVANAMTDVYERSDGSTVSRKPEVNNQPSAAEQPATGNNDDRFRELLHQFVGQTLFGQMLKAMRATQEKNPYFHGGRAEEIFQGQLDQVLTDKLTKATSNTLSEPMYKLMKANLN